MTALHVGVAGPVDLRLLADLVEPTIPRPGYAFPFTAHLVRALVERGHRVSVFASDEEGAAPATYRGERLTVYVAPMRPRARHRALDGFREERRYLSAAMRDARPDVVHAHWTYEFALAAMSTRLPAVVTAHDWAPSVLRLHRDPYRAIRLAMQTAVLARARHVTAVSPYIAERVTRWYRKPVTVVPNGVAAAGPREGTGVPRRVGALNVGFDRRKNVTALLAAFARVPDAELHLAGPGYEPGGPAAAWAAAHGATDRVTFRGPLAPGDTTAFLDALDVFAHPSLEESFGMVVLEAMGRGVPVVAGERSGAVPWLLDGGRAGWLADVRDPAALGTALGRALDDREESARRAAVALSRAATEFSLDAAVEAYEAEYLRALSGE